MPIYEYACDHCGHELEALQRMAEDPLRHCPKCDEETLRKLVSAPSFRLKGSGWYETDFKNKQPKPGAAAASSSSSDDNAKDKTSTSASVESSSSEKKEATSSGAVSEK